MRLLARLSQDMSGRDCDVDSSRSGKGRKGSRRRSLSQTDNARKRRKRTTRRSKENTAHPGRLCKETNNTTGRRTVHIGQKRGKPSTLLYQTTCFKLFNFPSRHHGADVFSCSGHRPRYSSPALEPDLDNQRRG